jgi:hypothetical protein
MKPNDIIEEMRRCAVDARCSGVDHAEAVRHLADAIEQAANLLDQQQRFLIDLRNHKADA